MWSQTSETHSIFALSKHIRLVVHYRGVEEDTESACEGFFFLYLWKEMRPFSPPTNQSKDRSKVALMLEGGYEKEIESKKDQIEAT